LGLGSGRGLRLGGGSLRGRRFGLGCDLRCRFGLWCLSDRGRFPAAGVRFADDRQLAADLDGVVLLGDDLGQHPGGRRGDLGVDFVGGDLQQRFIQLDRVTLLLEPTGDGALSDALAECRHLDGEGHVC
jgi:hypothetical protein